ncbi:F-box family protein [Euphorbia peplus]|nr:F-box family protein [Euphorbia peplus]
MEENNNMDMFNSLPHSLLVAIVSSLPFKEAARTSILSKQWLSVWRETTNLEFYETFFVNHEEPEENQRIQRNNFVEFVTSFLQNYPQKPIQRFTISCSKPDDFVTQMKNFVLFAVLRNVRELEVDLSDPNWSENDTDKYEAEVDLPLQAYQNRDIESLKLFMCKFNASAPVFTNFRVLKNVSFGWIEIRIRNVTELFDSCPVLESLSLKKCWGLEHFEICTPDLRLKKLVIDKCDFIQDYIYIEGPKLKFLKYSGRIGSFHMFNQRELVEVDIDFGMEPQFNEVGSLVYDFVQEVYSAHVLTVCSVFLQMVPQGEEPFGFQCPLEVRHLILKTAMHFNEYIGMKFMLNSCPNLQTLTLEIGDAKIFSDYKAPFAYNPNEYWSKNLIVEKCINTSLEMVEVKGFKGTRSQLYVLRYIIHFARKLKQVNIYLPEDENQTKIRDICMAMLPRFKPCSPNLSLSIF